MNAGELLSGLVQARVSGAVDMPVTSLSDDSREVTPGACFVAVPGCAVDARRFVGDAIRQGARVVVTQGPIDAPAGVVCVDVPDARKALAELAAQWHGQPAQEVKCIGITGTNGKTTTAYLIRHLFEQSGRPTGLMGTVEYDAGGERRSASQTTPDPLSIHAMLAEMRDAGRYRAVMEVSSHALDQDRVAGIPFEGAVFTNLSHDHLDYHGTPAAYLAAKLKLFAGLSPGAFAIVNRDDAVSDDVVEACVGRVFTYGMSRRADFRARISTMTADGTRFELETAQGKRTVSTRLVGRHNAYNLLAAMAAACTAGLAIERVVEAAETFPGVPGRLERVDGGACDVFVDYAHTDDALHNVLESLRSVASGRLIAVFGCGGDRDRAKRPKMGAVVETYADVAVVTSDNPRSERPEQIIDEIVAGMQTPQDAVIEVDRRDAIARALDTAREGDCVLIAGKGHEGYQIFADRTIDFDDRVVAREILAARRVSA